MFFRWAPGFGAFFYIINVSIWDDESLTQITDNNLKDLAVKISGRNLTWVGMDINNIWSMFR